MASFKTRLKQIDIDVLSGIGPVVASDHRSALDVDIVDPMVAWYQAQQPYNGVLEMCPLAHREPEHIRGIRWWKIAASRCRRARCQEASYAATGPKTRARRECHRAQECPAL